MKEFLIFFVVPNMVYCLILLGMDSPYNITVAPVLIVGSPVFILAHYYFCGNRRRTNETTALL